MKKGLEILKRIGYDNESITATEEWVAKEVYYLALKDAEQSRQGAVSGSFGLSTYVKSLFEKGSPMLIFPVRMNKKRARYALEILRKMQSELDILMDSPDEQTYSEYQLAITWMKNQILKRYSIAETVL